MSILYRVYLQIGLHEIDGWPPTWRQLSRAQSFSRKRRQLRTENSALPRPLLSPCCYTCGGPLLRTLSYEELWFFMITIVEVEVKVVVWDSGSWIPTTGSNFYFATQMDRLYSVRHSFLGFHFLQKPSGTCFRWCLAFHAGIYLELEWSYCFSLVDFIKYSIRTKDNETSQRQTSYRLRTFGNTHLKSLTRWFQVMGIPRKGGQCLAVIYSNIAALNTKLFTRYVRRHPSKNINTTKLREKLFRCLREP